MTITLSQSGEAIGSPRHSGEIFPWHSVPKEQRIALSPTFDRSLPVSPRDAEAEALILEWQLPFPSPNWK